MKPLKVRVLFVTDDQNSAQRLGLALAPHGMSVSLVDAGHLAAMDGELDHDVCVVDIRSPTAREVIEILSGRLPVLAVGPPDANATLNAVEAGARGYLLLGSPPTRIASALVEMSHGGAVLPHELLGDTMEEVSRRDRERRRWRDLRLQLTDRECDVLLLLTEGRTTGEIAAALSVESVTVRSHIAGLVRKLDVEDRDGLLQWWNEG